MHPVQPAWPSFLLLIYQFEGRIDDQLTKCCRSEKCSYNFKSTTSCIEHKGHYIFILC